MATSQVKKFQKGGTGNISPWDLKITRTDDGKYKVSVIPGLLNNYLATNWEIEKELSGDAMHYCKAVVKTDGKNISSVTIAIDTNTPKNQKPLKWSIESTIEILFGLIKSGVGYRTVPIGQIIVSPKLWIRATREEPVDAGEVPYDEYYYLT